MIEIKEWSKKLLIALVLITSTFSNSLFAQDSIMTDYSKLITAIGKVESGLNDKAKSGVHAGFLQISEVCVRECNRINKLKGVETRYTLQDRYDHEKSIEMFYIIQDFYNKEKDIDYAILLWNEGNSAMKRPKRKTKYYIKVMEHYKGL